MVHIPPDALHHLFNSWALAKLHLAQLHHMTPHQLIALGVITTQEKMSFKELRRILAVPMSSFTFVIDKLEKQQLVKRYRDEQDRRQWLVRPTSKGIILGGEIHKKESEVLSTLLGQVPDSEK